MNRVSVFYTVCGVKPSKNTPRCGMGPGYLADTDVLRKIGPLF
jgi:hypothetical protein